MPYKSAHACSRCKKPTHNKGLCLACAKKEKQLYDLQRGNSGERGYDATWTKVRNIYAAEHPLCEEHLKQGIDILLDIVHHIKSVKEYPELRLVEDNLMSLCIKCHEAVHGIDRFKRKE